MDLQGLLMDLTAFVTGKCHRKVNTSARGTYQGGVKMAYLWCIFWACALKRRGQVFTRVQLLVDLLFCAMYCIKYIRSYTYSIFKITTKCPHYSPVWSVTPWHLGAWVYTRNIEFKLFKISVYSRRTNYLTNIINRASSTINIVTDPNALILNNLILSNRTILKKFFNFLSVHKQDFFSSFMPTNNYILSTILFYSNSFFIFIIKFNNKKEEKNLSE